MTLHHLWPSTGKPGTTQHPSKILFLHLQSCRHPNIELSKFYYRSLSCSRYNRPNRSLPSAWNNTFLRDRSIFSRCLRTPRCARFSHRRSHLMMLFIFPLHSCRSRVQCRIHLSTCGSDLRQFILDLELAKLPLMNSELGSNTTKVFNYSTNTSLSSNANISTKFQKCT